MRRIMENTIDRGLVLIGSLTGDLPACVAVAVEAGKVTARDLQPDAVARQEHVSRGPQVEPEFVDCSRFEQFRLRE